MMTTNMLLAATPMGETNETVAAIIGCCFIFGLIFALAILIKILLWFLRKLGGSGSLARRRCTWCGGTKLKFIEGHEGERMWQYRNRGGGQDKRVKDNYQKAAYYSTWECKKCSARTRFTHYVDRNPSKHVNIWKAVNTKDGEGEQTNGDYELEGGTFVDGDAANRKGDD